MPVTIEGQTYYRTIEVCRVAGISRNTLFRWLNQGILSGPDRDWRGWRLFTQAQVDALKARTQPMTTKIGIK
jgi:DNA-binding transcriptional MerR regulator